MSRKPRLIFQTQGAHFAQIAFDPDVTATEIDALCFHHFGQPETPGTYLTSLLKPGGDIVTYHSKRQGF
jgi:hypothetical protein